MINDTLDIMSKWLHIEDSSQIKIIIAAAVAAFFPGDPVWMFIVGPSGSTKTEILRSMTNSEYIYTLDNLTAKSLVTGFRGTGKDRSQDYDLLPKLDGKLLIIKDLSPLLEQGSQKDKESVFTILRSVYDGYYEAYFGSGFKEKKSYKATFGFISGVTEVIDYYTKIHSLLGERFLKVRTCYDRKAAMKAAFNNSGREVEMRKEISDVMRITLDFYRSLGASKPRLSDVTGNRINSLADCVAILRSPVPRDYKHEVSYLLRAEVATRLGKQLLRLAESLFRIGCWDYNYLLRVARDTVIPERLKVVNCLREGNKKSITDISSETEQPRNIVKYACEDLWIMKVLERSLNADTFSYKLRDDFAQSLEDGGL